MGSRTVVAAAVLLLLSSASIAQAEAPPCSLERGETRAIARLVDGETLVLDDGRFLRLIGALAPRASDVGAEPGNWPAENDARAALKALVEGRTATLWHDSARLDRYGQMLAQVTIGDTWLQKMLVERGHARSYGRPGADACTPELTRIERQARENGVGLWANAAYRVRDAARPGIGRAVGTFQVVEGAVRQRSRGSNTVYLTFASPRGATAAYSFAAAVPGGRSDLIDGVDVRALVGRRVRVRGWIEYRRGPVIVVDSKGQIELVGE